MIGARDTLQGRVVEGGSNPSWASQFLKFQLWGLWISFGPGVYGGTPAHSPVRHRESFHLHVPEDLRHAGRRLSHA